MSVYLRMIQSVTSRYNDHIRKNSSHFCEYFGIAQFWYNHVDDQGIVGTVSDHAEWTEYFAAQKLYHHSTLLRHSSRLQEGFSILEFDEDPDMIQIQNRGKSKNEKHTYIALVNKTKNGSEQFGFCVNKAAVSLFFNETALIQYFASKFRESNQFILSKLEDNKVNMLDLIGDVFYKPSSAMDPSLIAKKALLAKLGIDSFVLKEQETKALRLLIQGFSASEIAPQIFLAKRTVEHLFERIKDKLCCDSKKELIQKAREMEALGVL